MLNIIGQDVPEQPQNEDVLNREADSFLNMGWLWVRTSRRATNCPGKQRCATTRGYFIFKHSEVSRETRAEEAARGSFHHNPSMNLGDQWLQKIS
jgi:hypothetical protein